MPTERQGSEQEAPGEPAQIAPSPPDVARLAVPASIGARGGLESWLSGASADQRATALLGLQRGVGNAAVSRALAAAPSAPTDASRHEEDVPGDAARGTAESVSGALPPVLVPAGDAANAVPDELTPIAGDGEIAAHAGNAADFVDGENGLWDHKFAKSGRGFDPAKYLDKIELNDIRNGERIMLNHEA